jgi:hypothetical protein
MKLITHIDHYNVEILQLTTTVCRLYLSDIPSIRWAAFELVIGDHLAAGLESRNRKRI